MSFESSLNAIWILLGICALTSTIRYTWAKQAAQSKRRAWPHVVCAGLIVAALFPYISATDDLLRVAHFSDQKLCTTSRTNQTNELMRLYQAMDTPIIAEVRRAGLVLFFVVFVTPLQVQQIDGAAPRQGGRSPPAGIPA